MYHYAGNNPVRYIDPDGRSDALTIAKNLSEGVMLAYGAKALVVAGAKAIGTAVASITPAGWVVIGVVVVGGIAYTAYRQHERAKAKEQSLSLAQAKTQEKNPNHVKVQFQGPSIKGGSRNAGEGDKEINIWSDTPIPADVVKAAVTAKYNSLSKKEQAVLADSYNQAMNYINRAESGGGVAGSAAPSFSSRSGKPGDRVDFVIAGDINLIP